MDRYEVKARLLPALLSLLPTAPGLASLGTMTLDWYTTLLVEGGVATICVYGLNHFASAVGRRYEQKLWPRQPYDLPTHLWLHPEHSRISPQQKQLYYKAILDILGLDISQAAAAGDSTALEQTIDGAIRDLRNKFRVSYPGGLLATHNEEYGFARNFAGLRPVWLAASLFSVGVTSIVFATTGTGLAWGLLATAILLLAVLIAVNQRDYVHKRAERYAESFFSTLADFREGKLE